jgi:Na+/melibiose symporter-like transporter
VNPAALPRAGLWAYAALALPLAMAALPVYVHVPKLYADDLGLSLGLVGAILLAARLLDAIQDPLLGWWSDRAAGGGRGRFVVAALPLLALGVIGLFNPPSLSPGALAAWLGACLVVVYLGFSMASISYYAIGAELSTDYHERTRVTAARGVLGVTGVLLAAALPALLAGEGPESAGLRSFSLLFVPVLLAGAGLMLFLTPAPRVAPGPRTRLLASLAGPAGNPSFRWLVAVFVVSGVASAVPATLILFYVQDVLGRSDLNGPFLGLYFLLGAAGMPLWVEASRRVGKKSAWLLGMAMSIVAFAGAFALGTGDAVAFGVVCALSGLAYGAELALPPSILADVVDRDAAAAAARPDGAYFGLWQFTEKLNLALAAGMALPVLGVLGYQPGSPQPAMGTLSFMYAALPCLLKLAAVALLWAAPIERLRWQQPVTPGASLP